MRIIEECLLGILRNHLLTEKTIDGMVEKANAYLIEEANKPRVNTAPIKASIRDKEAKIKRLFKRIEGCDDEALVQAYEKHISEHQKEVNQLRAELKKAEDENTETPPPLDADRLKTHLGDMRGRLNQEIAVSAEVIRSLTGPIQIRQEPIPGRKHGARWIATFTPNLLALLRQVAKDKDCPDSITLEHLSTRIWTTLQTVEVVIDHTPKYEQIAAPVEQMIAKGASVVTIAHALGHTAETVTQARDFVKTGQRPKAKPHGKKTGTRSGPPKYISLAPEVVRLREEKKMSFTKIAKMKGASESTITRAYDYARPEATRAAAAQGQTPKRGGYSHLGEAVFQKIHDGLALGKKPEEIAQEAGCSVGTVYRERTRMRRPPKKAG